MRWSTLFAPTLRDAPADAEAPSHQLLIRAGFIRPLSSGHYTLLPLGFRVRQKVERIVAEEMDRIGGQGVMMPTMHPASVWETSGRLDSMGSIMFRLKDRNDAEQVLGTTAEEIFAIVASELTSYKQLPQIWYQMHTKYHDEPRPKSGLLRTREFTMKDSYSFDIDEAGLDNSFELHRQAYVAIFERLDLDAIPVKASSGNMGGTDSVEFMVPAPTGEDDVVRCTKCDYAANVEKATSSLPPVDDEGQPTELEKFSTPGVRTIVDLAKFDGGAPADRQVKTLVYVIDGTPTLVLVRGDHKLNEQKLIDATEAIDVRTASADETEKLLGAQPGSLGAVQVEGVRIFADHALEGRRGMATGANDDDFHYRGVDVGRDIPVISWADLREVSAGEACPECGTALELVATIESGHIFKLGRKFAETFDVKVSDADGKQQTVIMGSYGIGIERAMATVVETHHDDKGIAWPVACAPFEAVVTLMRADGDCLEAGERIYAGLQAAGVDVIIDDRDIRAGVKFADSELVGIPFRVTIGPKGLDNGIVELTNRATMTTEEVAIDAVVEALATKINDAR